MSYADVAASGPPQAPEDARAPPMPEVENVTVEDSVSLIDVDSPQVSTVPSDFSSQSIRTDTQAERLEREAADAERRAAEKAKREAAKAKSAASSAAHIAEKNADNPVVIGNVVVVGAFAAILGTQMYKYYKQDGFSWTLFGLGLGAVTAVGTADYFVSKFFFRKYPPKK